MLLKLKYLLLILITIPVSGFCQQFTASVIDIETGELKIYSGMAIPQKDQRNENFRKTTEMFNKIIRYYGSEQFSSDWQ